MFISFDKYDGLSNNNITCLLRDSKGFIWIGTSDGLNRYDGYSFKTFFYEPDNPTTIRSSRIKYLAEDYNSRIWIGTENYIDIYDPIKETIYRADSLFGGKLKIQAGSIWDLRKDRFGHYWFISSAQGLFKYMVAEDSLIKVLHGYQRESLNLSNLLPGFCEDSDGNVWVVSSKDIIKKINNNSTTVVDSIVLLKKSDSFYGLFIDSDDDLWLYNYLHAEGITYINSDTKKISYFNTESKKCKLKSDVTFGVIEDSKGRIWIATDHGGINIIDKSDFSIQYLLNDPLNKRAISENTITEIYRDYEDFIWCGTYKQGAFFYHNDLFKFYHYKVRLANDQSARITDIDNFAEDKYGNLWIGTNGGGLLYYNRKKNTYKQYKHDPNNQNSISSDIIVGLLIDSKDNLWIGTYLGGLDHWDGKKFIHYKNDPNDSTTLTDNRVWHICEDKDGLLWIGTLLGGVNLIDPRTEKITQSFGRLNNTSLRSVVIRTIIEDSEGIIWFATGNGVRSYNKEKNCITYFEANPDIPNSLSNNFTFDILEDSRGLIWIASASGINIYNKSTKQITILREKDGLPSNRILTLLEDDHQNIWAGTSNGISNILVNYNTNNKEYTYSFINYDELDGLQGKEFNAKAAYKTRNGELIFGGSNGFNLFKPDEIKPSKHEPNIIFTDFLVFNKSYSNKEKLHGRYLLKNSITYTDHIQLYYTENVFTIEFADLNYFHPSRRIYQYRLDKFNNDWITTTSDNRRITYTNLNPGSYVFRVRVYDPDELWNSKESKLKITILPPLWKTWGFRIGVFLFVLSLIVFVFYLRFHQLNKQKRKLEQKVAERTEELQNLNTILEERQEEITIQNEELNQHRYKLEKLVNERTADLAKALKKAEESDRLKSAFLANMSHEVRTPMNAIIGFSDLVRDESLNHDERNEYIEIIQNNCDSLLVIINDILDFSAIEADQITVTESSFDLIQLLQEINNYYNLKDYSHIEIKYEKASGINHLYIKQDVIRIKQVIQNLINNSIKFTEKGYVKFGFNLLDDKIKFYVEDTGIGIKPKDYEKVFSPFTKIENKETKYYSGAGLGLAISYKIAKLLNGKLEFESEVGKGTIFYFTIPTKLEKNTKKT